MHTREDILKTILSREIRRFDLPDYWRSGEPRKRDASSRERVPQRVAPAARTRPLRTAA